MDADIFFDALADFVGAAPETPLELNGKWHEGEFILTPEGRISPEVLVDRNRIITPDFTFVIRLEQDQAQPNALEAHPLRVNPRLKHPYPTAHKTPKTRVTKKTLAHTSLNWLPGQKAVILCHVVV